MLDVAAITALIARPWRLSRVAHSVSTYLCLIASWIALSLIIAMFSASIVELGATTGSYLETAKTVASTWRIAALWVGGFYGLLLVLVMVATRRKTPDDRSVFNAVMLTPVAMIGPVSLLLIAQVALSRAPVSSGGVLCFGWVLLFGGAIVLMLQSVTLLDREFLRKSDLCPQCQYSLRGLTSNRCPECGCRFRPDDDDQTIMDERAPWS